MTSPDAPPTDVAFSHAQAGLDDVGTAVTQFSESVYDDIVDALADAGSGAAAAVTGETAATLSDAFASVI